MFRSPPSPVEVEPPAKTGKALPTVLIVGTPLLLNYWLGRLAWVVIPLVIAAILARALYARRTRARIRDVRTREADVPARRVPGRVRMWGAACLLVAAGLWLLVLRLGALPVLGGGVLLVVAVIFYRGAWRQGAKTKPTALVKPVDRAVWLDELPERVADAVDAAGLVRGYTHPDPDGQDVDALTRLRSVLSVPARATAGERVELLGPPMPAGDGGASLTLALGEARVLPEDVIAAEETWRRHLGVAVLAWEPIDVRHLRLHAYLDHPLRAVVDWRALRPVHSQLEEAPFGATAVPGRQVTFRWRISHLIVGASGGGKSGTVRAMLAGLMAQGVPVRLHLIDNKVDYADMAYGARGGYVTTSHPDALDLLATVTDRMQSRYADRAAWPPGYRFAPTAADPLEVLVIGELLDFLDAGTSAQRAEAARLTGLIARRGRDAAVVVEGTAQTSIKAAAAGLDLIRDLFPGRILHAVPNASMIAPALGVGVDKGAAAHQIPAALEGVGYAVDAESMWPVMFRSAFVPPFDQLELAARIALSTTLEGIAS